ncbi:MAG TPA: hypothetical protein VES20_23445 [Bryobacteraceae bacterium]|nr:hypothetical protein [Bryobacteraceae bacterium]
MNFTIPFGLVRRITIAATLCLSYLHAQGPVVSGPLYPTVVRDNAENLRANSPALQALSIREYRPMFAPRSTRIVFWEAKLEAWVQVGSFPLHRFGYIILKHSDGKVVEYSTKTRSHYDRLSEMTSQPFKMVRLGSAYVAAESPQGNILAGIGEFPMLFRHRTAPTLSTANPIFRTTFSPTQGIFGSDLYRPYSGEEEAYADYALNYDAYFLNFTPRPLSPTAMLWRENVVDGETGGGGGGGTGAPARYYNALGNYAFRFKQVKPGTQYSDKSWATGCGPTALMNLFMWHDLNWTPSVLHGDPFGTLKGDYTDLYAAANQKDLRDFIGTAQSPFKPEQGYTWPHDMYHGFQWLRERHGHRAEYTEAANLISSSDAVEVAKYYLMLGKPVIIGYKSAPHYDLAYSYHAFPNASSPGYYLIQKDSGAEKWIHGDDLFYAAGMDDVYWDFSTVITNPSFESGMKNWTKIGNAKVMLRSSDAKHGTAFFHAWGNNGGFHGLSRSISLNNANALGYLLKFWVRTSNDITGVVEVKNAAGTRMTSKYIMPTFGQWREETIEIPKTTGSTANLSIQVPAGYGIDMYMDLDRITITPVMPTGGGDPHLPCITGKPDLDEGCEWR